MAAPCVLIWVTSEDVWNHLEGQNAVDQASVQVDSYGTTRGQANDIAYAIKQHLAAFLYGTMGNVLIRELVRETGIVHGVDRPTDGSAAYRYISGQKFSVTYDS